MIALLLIHKYTLLHEYTTKHSSRLFFLPDSYYLCNEFFALCFDVENLQISIGWKDNNDEVKQMVFHQHMQCLCSKNIRQSPVCPTHLHDLTCTTYSALLCIQLLPHFIALKTVRTKLWVMMEKLDVVLGGVLGVFLFFCSHSYYQQGRVVLSPGTKYV